MERGPALVVRQVHGRARRHQRPDGLRMAKLASQHERRGVLSVVGVVRVGTKAQDLRRPGALAVEARLLERGPAAGEGGGVQKRAPALVVALGGGRPPAPRVGMRRQEREHGAHASALGEALEVASSLRRGSDVGSSGAAAADWEGEEARLLSVGGRGLSSEGEGDLETPNLLARTLVGEEKGDPVGGEGLAAVSLK